MKAEDIQNLKDKINIVDFLNHEGAKIRKKEDGQYVGICPFHENGEDFLDIDIKKKEYSCGWCEVKGDIFDYVKDALKLDEKKAFEHLNSYWEKVKPAPKYEIIELNRYELLLRIGDRRYQITNTKLNKINHFSMTVKLEHEDKYFLSDVNLSRPKSRDEFVNEASDTVYLSQEIIRGDLKAVLEAVAKLQKENIEKEEEQIVRVRNPVILSSDDETKAKDYLASKDVFNECLLKDTERLGYTGDELGKKILYACATSRLLPDPMAVLSIGNSSAGKSFAQAVIASMVPNDHKYEYTRITPKSLSHFDRYALMNQLFIVDEIGGSEEDALYQVRSMLSKKMLSVGFTSVDKLSGKMETLSRDIYGPIAFMSSTTNLEAVDDETVNRLLLLTMDESAEQTLKVIESMIFSHTKKGYMIQREREKVIRKYQIMQSVLNPVHVLIPDTFIKEIKLKRRRLTVKRQLKNYLSLLYSIALHRQYQRKVFTEKDSSGEYYSYTYVTRADIDDANKLIDEVYQAYPGELDPVNQKVYNGIWDYSEDKSKQIKTSLYEIEFTRRDIRERIGMEHTPCRRAFEKLLELEYIVKTTGAYRSRHYYKLVKSDMDMESIESWIKL